MEGVEVGHWWMALVFVEVEINLGDYSGCQAKPRSI